MFKTLKFDVDHDFIFEKAVEKLDSATDYAMETLLKLRVECEELKYVNQELRAEIQALKQKDVPKI